MSPFSSLRLFSCLCFLVLALGFPGVAQAHTGHLGSLSSEGGQAFWTGFFHPLGGLDHLLAMIAVGLWAAQQGGRAVWAVPVCFVGAMAFGGILGMQGGEWSLVGVESGIAGSVLVLGLCIAWAVRWPWSVSAVLVGFFALAHGAAHGAELPGGLSAWGYTLGFVLATALLHAVGLAVGLLLGRWTPAPVLRWAGGAIAFVGGLLLVKTI